MIRRPPRSTLFPYTDALPISSQVLNFRMEPITQTTDEVFITAPDEKPSTILHRRIVRNKHINNKEKLEAYSYQSYNKIQLDLNNIGDDFEGRKIVQIGRAHV